jgi:hypothetical protein
MVLFHSQLYACFDYTSLIARKLIRRVIRNPSRIPKGRYVDNTPTHDLPHLHPGTEERATARNRRDRYGVSLAED